MKFELVIIFFVFKFSNLSK